MKLGADPLDPFEDLKKYKKKFCKILVDMINFYEQQGHAVYSLGFNDLEEETGFCYNCREENLTYLFVITAIGGTGIIQSSYGTKTKTKLAVIFLLCPVCARKYNEDKSILIKVVEEFKSCYKTELSIVS